MQKIHLDTDLGGDIDDLCALALVLNWPETALTGITVPGDTGGRRAGYVRAALEIAGRADIPVAAGADTAHFPFRYPLDLPDEARYWPSPVAPAPGPLDAALELLKASIEQGAVIAAIGPLTNLALLGQKYPGILRESRLVIMGGFVHPVPGGCPPWTNADDFNLQVDVPSARRVLESARPTLVQLPATAVTALRRADLEPLRVSTNPLCRLIARQAEAFAGDERMHEKYRSCPGVPADLINFQYDGAACAVALGWRDGVQIEELPLVFEEQGGYLYERIAPEGKSIPVVTRIDGTAFGKLWLERVTSA